MAPGCPAVADSISAQLARARPTPPLCQSCEADAAAGPVALVCPAKNAQRPAAPEKKKGQP